MKVADLRRADVRLVVITREESYGSDDHYLKLHVRPIVASDSDPSGFSYPSDHGRTAGLAGLGLFGQLDSKTARRTTEFYGCEPAYDVTTGTVRRQDAVRMADTLNWLTRKLDALVSEWGSPVDNAAAVAMFGRALGTSKFGTVETAGSWQRGTPTEYRWHNVDQLRWWLNSTVNDWRKRMSIQVEAAS